MSLRGQVILGLKWTSLATIVVALTGLLKIGILARYLDTSDFGLMALVTFIMGFMTLFSDFGLSTAILHFQDISKKVYSSLYWFNVFLCIILYILLFLLSPIIADFYDEVELKFLIPLLGLNLLISSFGQQFKTIEIKNLLFRRIGLIDITASILGLILAVYLAIKGFGILALIYSALLQYIISNICYVFIGIRNYGLLLHFNFRETKPFLKIGYYQVGGQVVNYFNRDIDILIIGKFFSTEILGGYSLAKQLVYRPVQIINPILVKVATPTLAKFQSDLNRLKKNYLRLVNLVSSINIPIYVCIMIFAPLIIDVIYGSSYGHIVVLVRILCVYMIFRMVGNPIGSLITATGKTHVEFYWNLLNLMILPIVIFLAAQLGIVEVTLSMVLYMIVLFIPSWRILVFSLTKATLKEYTQAIILLNFDFLNYFLKKKTDL